MFASVFMCFIDKYQVNNKIWLVVNNGQYSNLIPIPPLFMKQNFGVIPPVFEERREYLFTVINIYTKNKQILQQVREIDIISYLFK